MIATLSTGAARTVTAQSAFASDAPSVVSVGLYALGASFWKMRALRAERRKSEAALHMLDLEASAYGAQVARFCALRLAGGN